MQSEEVGELMAKPRGLYTPVYASLPRHAKVQAAALELRCDRYKLVGHLVSLWTWCLDGMPLDGAPLTAGTVALGADWPTRQAERFAEALADVGLLERVDGGYEVHEWEEYGGKVARLQQADRERHSAEIPQSFPRTSSLDETRREEKKSPTDSKQKRARGVDEAFIEELVAEFSGTFDEARIRSELETAQNRKQWDSYKDKRAHFRGWLKRAKEWQEQRERTQGGAGTSQGGRNGGYGGAGRVPRAAQMGGARPAFDLPQQGARSDFARATSGDSGAQPA
jgi:hypothetical protein